MLWEKNYQTIFHLLDSLLFGGGQKSVPSVGDPMGDGSTPRYDVKGKGRAKPDGDMLALDLGSAEEGMGGHGGYSQMQLVEQQVRSSSFPSNEKKNESHHRKIGQLHSVSFNCY